MSGALPDQPPVIVGAGVAGLATALFLAPRPCVLVTRAPLEQDGSSPLAQGGMAAALADDDSVDLHLADTLSAGAGLCDAAMARRILAAVPAAISALERIGARLDREQGGRLALGLEAAHSRRRIVHAGGDGTGRELVRALAAAVRATASVTVLEGLEARRLLRDEAGIRGLLLARGDTPVTLHTRQVVLATGGLGAVFADTTNPLSSFGLGLALAARAGAVLADLEFVQFHPTALVGAGRPLALISEAVRGEGARLVTADGTFFLDAVPGGELAPRDVVARAVAGQLAEGRAVYLDARAALGPRFASRFPAVAALCAAAGLDPARQLLPVRPAAHYHMGGIAVDLEGRSSVPGLWACGEVAATGLHGANRLASNSLVEAVVCARWVADSLAGGAARKTTGQGATGQGTTGQGTSRRGTARESLPPAPDPAAVQPITSAHLGVVRREDGLRDAITTLAPLAHSATPAAEPALVALMMAVAAHQRTESRGAHWRADHPAEATASGPGTRSRLTCAEVRAHPLVRHALSPSPRPLPAPTSPAVLAPS
ncbi:L-aspartate oxidase [Xanthobacter sp. ZOL 2024]